MCEQGCEGSGSVVQRSGYEAEQIQGWTVMFEFTDWGYVRSLLRNVLDTKLQEIERVLPSLSLSRVRAAVCIYADLVTNDSVDVAVFHPTRAADWLVSHHEPIRKAPSINIFAAQRFIDLVENPNAYPAALLHEVAHAFHCCILNDGFDDPRVVKVFCNAMAQGKYRAVESVTGVNQDSNAVINQMEYFANTTTSYFLKNDAYPFTRDDLLSYDPDAFRLMQECWI